MIQNHERRKDARDRQAILASLAEQLRHGDKSLVGNNLGLFVFPQSAVRVSRSIETVVYICIHVGAALEGGHLSSNAGRAEKLFLSIKYPNIRLRNRDLR
jgi:hypothetical protein